MPDAFLVKRPADGESDDGVEPAYDLIELLFFAYRDFVADADAVLVDYGFGRAHHRVLHFVDRNPGLRVRDLLALLRITKQSLARVLKSLVDGGFIRQQAGPEDRREKRLFTTAEGHALAQHLALVQTRRVNRAAGAAGHDTSDAVRRFLLAMIGDDQRREIADRLGMEANTKADDHSRR